MFLSDFFVLNEMSFVIKGEEYCLRRTGEANGTLESSSQSTCLLHGRFNVKIILFELVGDFVLLYISFFILPLCPQCSTFHWLNQ